MFPAFYQQKETCIFLFSWQRSQAHKYFSRQKHVSSFSLSSLIYLVAISVPNSKLIVPLSQSLLSMASPGKIFASFLFLYIKSLFLLNFLCMLVNLGLFGWLFVVFLFWSVHFWFGFGNSPLSRSIRDPPSQRFIFLKISFPFLTPRNLVLGNGHSVCVTNCK